MDARVSHARPASPVAPSSCPRRAGGRRRWVCSAVLAATGPLLGGAARADSRPAPPRAATVTTTEDVADADDAHVSLREAIDALHPGGDGVRFDVPADGDVVIPPLFSLRGAIPAGREGVEVHLDDATRGAVELIVSSASGPHRLDPTFTGAGTVHVDFGGGAAELTLAGLNTHARTNVVAGTAVAASSTAFGKHLHLESGGGARLEQNAYLARLTGGGTLNLGDSLLQLGVFPADPADPAKGADGPGYGGAFAGSLAGSEDAGVVKAGSGTVTLTGTSTYGGGTVVLDGVLEVGSAASLGTGRVLLSNNATLRTLGVLNDRPAGAAADAPAAFLREVRLEAGGGVLDLNGTEQLFAGPLTGSGGLSVLGGGTLTLAGANAHRRGTTVFDSTLVLASATALGTGDLGLNGATLRTAHTEGAVAYAGKVAVGADGATIETSGGDWVVAGGLFAGPDGGSLTKTGAGELRLLAPGTLEAITVAGGSLAVTGMTALGQGTLTLDGGELFTPLAGGQHGNLRNRVKVGPGGGTLRTPGDVKLVGKLSGGGELVKEGEGTLTLAGENASTGGLVVRDGAVKAESAEALGTGRLTLNGGALRTDGGLTLGGDGTPGGFTVLGRGGTIDHDGGLSSTARTVVGGDVHTDGNLELTGGGTFVFAPDTLHATGGATRVDRWTTLEVETAVNSVILERSARLTGSGRVLGDVSTKGGGTVDPGDGDGGPGMLEIDGDLRVGDSGVLHIDAGPRGADFVHVGGVADLHRGEVRVNVDPGTAGDRVAFARTIAGGGASADLTVLAAAGGIARGPSETTTAHWAFDAAVVDRQHTGASAEPLTVRLSRVSGGTEVFGENNVGAAADAVLALLPTATGASAELFADLAFAEKHAAREALRGMTGDGYGGLSGVSFAGAGAVRRTTFRALRPGGVGGASAVRGQSPTFRGQTADAGGGDEFGFGSFDLATADVPGSGVRTADAGDGDSGDSAEQASFVPGTRSTGANPLPWGGFAEGYAVFGEAGSGAGETDFSTGGAVFGVDRMVSAGTRVGVLLGVGGANAEGGGMETDVTIWQVGLYGTRTAGRWHAAGAAVYGGENYETTRGVRVGSSALTADGETDGSTVTLAAETGYLLPVDLLDLRPLAGVQYVHASRDGYAETGMGAANLAFGDSSANSLRLQLGMRASKTLGDADRFAVVPEVRGWWFGEVLGDDAPAPVRFAAAPTLPAFTTVGDEQVNQWVLGTGLTFLAGPRFRTYAHSDLLLGEDTAALALTGGAELRW